MSGDSQREELMFRIRGGPFRAACWIADRVLDGVHDRRFGIVSSTRRRSKDLGFHSADFADYQAIGYRDLHQIFGLLALRPEDHFIDFGSGMGRAVCVAATLPLESVTGVEISPELCEIARENLRRIETKTQSRCVSIVNSNAIAYAIPRDTSVIFLFNPFGGAVLDGVLENLGLSLREFPRPIRLAFLGTLSAAQFQTRILKFPWLKLSSSRRLTTGLLALIYVNG